jgi:glycosyltransferase involved in cell wall biosynthesis
MKILHIIAGELTGGAARGAYWLHQGLEELNIDSKILTNASSDLGDKNVILIAINKKSKILNLIRKRLDNIIILFYPNRKKIIFSTGFWGYNFTKTKEYKEADIINLHWINGGFVNIKHLKKIKKPIVWTMRDMWPMTGGCHVAEFLNCQRYKEGCNKCKQLNSNKKYDLSYFVWNRKKRFIPRQVILVGISNWLSLKAKESRLYKNHKIYTIHNNIKIEEFLPIKKEVAKKILKLNTRKKVILVGSTSTSDIWKGFHKFLNAIKFLDKNKYFLCFFGEFNKHYLIKELGYEYKSFDYLKDNISLRLLYSASDVFVAPSIQEAFGKTLTEAMSCETPVVCFDATGPKDIVSHKIDGYKAKPFSSEDLAKGIEWVLNYDNYEDLCKNARKKVVENFDSRVIAEQYKKLYEEILN